MTAIACLRVVLEAGATGLREEVLGPLVERLAGAYLEMRWRWPREFKPLTLSLAAESTPAVVRAEYLRLALEGVELGRIAAWQDAYVLSEEP